MCFDDDGKKQTPEGLAAMVNRVADARERDAADARAHRDAHFALERDRLEHDRNVLALEREKFEWHRAKEAQGQLLALGPEKRRLLYEALRFRRENIPSISAEAQVLDEVMQLLEGAFLMHRLGVL